MVLGAILKTCRPKQWVKNLFVLAPLVFAKQLMDPVVALRSLAAVAAFCALSGAVYAFNDVLDVESDRAHPVKKFRPIAAGRLSERGAYILSVLLALSGLGAAWLLSPWFALVAAGYLTNNLAYSLGLKHVAYVDVSMIALGFVLRVLGGAIAIGVTTSHWLLICTALLASLLGFGKRAHEIVTVERGASGRSKTRESLRGYRLQSLGFVLLVLAFATSAAYALYTRDPHTMKFFQTSNLVFTLPFCILGIARFLQLALWKPRQESPTDAILHDLTFLLIMGTWTVVIFFIIYGEQAIN